MCLFKIVFINNFIFIIESFLTWNISCKQCRNAQVSSEQCLLCTVSYITCCLFFVFSWYFGKIKRIEAEKKLLQSENEQGAFLIRDSESRRNDFSLSSKIIYAYLMSYSRLS